MLRVLGKLLVLQMLPTGIRLTISFYLVLLLLILLILMTILKFSGEGLEVRLLILKLIQKYVGRHQQSWWMEKLLAPRPERQVVMPRLMIVLKMLEIYHAIFSTLKMVTTVRWRLLLDSVQEYKLIKNMSFN